MTLTAPLYTSRIYRGLTAATGEARDLDDRVFFYGWERPQGAPPEEQIVFRLYRSTNPSFDTVAEIEANGTPTSGSWQPVQGETVTIPSTPDIYYFNVISRDAATQKYAVHKKLKVDFRGPFAASTIAENPTDTTVGVRWSAADDLYDESLEVWAGGVMNWDPMSYSSQPDYEQQVATTVEEILSNTNDVSGMVTSLQFSGGNTEVLIDLNSQTLGTYVSKTVIIMGNSYTASSVTSGGIVFSGDLTGSIFENDSVTVSFKRYAIRPSSESFPRGINASPYFRYLRSDATNIMLSVGGDTYEADANNISSGYFELLDDQSMYSGAEAKLIVGAVLNLTMYTDGSFGSYPFRKNGSTYTPLSVSSIKGTPYVYNMSTPSAYYDEYLNITYFYAPTADYPATQFAGGFDLLNSNREVTTTYTGVYFNQGEGRIEIPGDVVGTVTSAAGYRYSVGGLTTMKTVAITGNNAIFDSSAFFGYYTPVTARVHTKSLIDYRLYYSTVAGSLDSIAEMEASGTPFGDYTTDATSATVTGLSPSTPYYFNVVARDRQGYSNVLLSNIHAVSTLEGSSIPAEITGSVTVEPVGGFIDIADNVVVKSGGHLTLNVTSLDQVRLPSGKDILVEEGGQITLGGETLLIDVGTRYKFRSVPLPL